MAKTDIIEALEITVVTSALLSTKPINDAWASLTDEDQMSWKSNLMVRSEMLWFFLHMLDRFAGQIGGTKVRDTLIDAIAQKAIEGAIIASFDASHVKKGVDVKEWQRDTTISALEEFNEAQNDYGSCTKLVGEFPEIGREEKTILGKLSARIGRQIGRQYDPNFRLLISTTAADALVKSELKKQVEKACGILR